MVKINNNKPPDGPGPRNVKKPGETPKAEPVAGGAGTGGPSDSIRISKQGKEAAQLVDAIGKLPEVRTDKVSEIKEAVNSGTYKVDASKVAEKIISEIV